MSRQNPVYPPVINYLNSLPEGKIFTLNDVYTALPNLESKYLKSLITQLSMKEFYIGKVTDEHNNRKILGYFKRRNIPTDKTITDICWFLKYDL